MSITTNRIENRITTVRGPKAHSATMHLVQSTRFAMRVAKLLMVGLILAIAAMAFLPWQQTSRGAGSVVAYVPQERQQTVEAPMEGVIQEIGDGLYEGSKVEKDQLIAIIEPFASNRIAGLNNQLKDIQRKQQAENEKAETYREQEKNYIDARDRGVKAYEKLVASARAKLSAKQKLIPGYQAKVDQKTLNYNRQARLLKKGAVPAKEVEKVKRDLDIAVSDLDSLHDDIKSLELDVEAKLNELEKERQLGNTKIEEARAKIAQAQGMAASAQKDIRDIELKLEELGRGEVRAPRDGTIFRFPANQLGDSVKKGDPIAVIVPDTTQKAVEMFVNGNDMPLVQPGQEVRLQFEGWPAVQFAGWPSVAVGTFSGVVATVDATDNGKGEFRILVIPNPKSEQAWPSDRYLRQGVRANGWVMLRQVKLGYEIWRQLNGFPVIVADGEPDKKTGKVPKLPK